MRRSDYIQFEADADALADLSDTQFASFVDWMKRLDAEHEKSGSFYGKGSLWSLTGAQCWLSCFLDGDDPADALAEDLSCDG